jgi:hypothetical protein
MRFAVEGTSPKRQSNVNDAQAELALLQRHLKPKYKTFIKRELVDIGDGQVLNTLTINNPRHEMENEDGSPRETLVLTHGYGSGLGFWFNNLNFFAELPYKVMAIDWLVLSLSLCSLSLSLSLSLLSLSLSLSLSLCSLSLSLSLSLPSLSLSLSLFLSLWSLSPSLSLPLLYPTNNLLSYFPSHKNDQ